MSTPRRRLSDWIVDRLWRGLMWGALRLPHGTRVAAMGWLFRNIVGPLTGRASQANANLQMVYPEMPKPERRRLTKAVLETVGRVVMENYATAHQMKRALLWQPSGPGWRACEEARAEGRPILFVSGHYGNYQAGRAALNVRGYRMGGLYRPLNNDYLNAHYIATIEDVGGGAFTRDRRGLAGFVKHIRSGAQGAILIDQYLYDGEILDFMGHPAPTSTAAAEMALKYDALLVPIYSTRLDNGLDFSIELEEPIPHSEPIAMTQALNDSLSARVHAAPEQWFWVHNRWKPERAEKARRRAARQSSR
ncbi:lysophospholipid acyltransferase family protein [Gymnodinialimonas ceratoperidinii]|uniref:Lysophospholipid acyltransferase family protein n=1 Tax=Gymnodinialimonas ceratoperidinii TaxID=2856823 RepID=A0A8F6TSF5_9RHOB|nr:lysophospholipid acyltransferase family protein [Gymnodinialimonas ceratoperidinii]QXT38126.1 lysophospholipid acyltransferase family protein [Gymnodinialimonas ceratoperidinii]